ncbi:holo-ACP synthase [Oribacterium sp. WCC10]|uniref:holo-ACP synthase n=1 Tax=Oribacterium sp. WCC10 TaxID=1855343 RepID=UPI0008E40A04|nr:holo-ACP synthase [Oribacterium sp. WCC10]SFG42056.1 holo-[acyl-carrier protein] synthase [Oribacterium sp. WCC10]
MIIGIGTDLLEIKRIANTRKNHTAERIFSEKELRQASDKDSMLAGDFACKECVVKCFGTGFAEGIRPIEIEILREDSGKPYVVLHGNALKKFEELGGKMIHVSITDTGELVSAFAVIEG